MLDIMSYSWLYNQNKQIFKRLTYLIEIPPQRQINCTVSVMKFEKSINKEYSYVIKTAEKMPKIPKSK